jgi:hypothetical protein
MIGGVVSQPFSGETPSQTWENVVTVFQVLEPGFGSFLRVHYYVGGFPRLSNQLASNAESRSGGIKVVREFLYGGVS